MKRIAWGGAFFLLLISLAAAQRLPELAVPENYKLVFTPDFTKDNFTGDEAIQVRVLKPTSQIVLNSADIEFGQVTISSEAVSQKATVTLDKEKEMATLTVEKELPAGAATIHIQYTGTLNSEMRGLYLGKDDEGRKYAATQFESTDARRAFPSFDEPAYKATFDISAIAPKNMVAISNAKIVADTPGPGENQHTVRFAISPKMSSYLAALIVGQFEALEGSADGIPIRVWSTPGKKEMGQFALEASENILSYFDKYFTIKYPYDKLDLVALPDFSAGAMENTGCITFREVLLLVDTKNGSARLRKIVAEVMAHEMAHQWFGDLVTMKWWDDVWLNEGFATWMSSKPVAVFWPEWNEKLDDVRQTTQALNVDALANTRPIHEPAETPAQILELFDGIAYGKAASVLRMVEAYLGPKTFQAGVNLYLKEHAYGNATSADFWNALTRASGKPVDHMMPTFVEQPGAPMVSVNAQCSGGSTKVSLKQQRYFYDRSLFEAGNSELWQIPICLKASSKHSQKCELLTAREGSITLPGCASWVLGNAGASGYYRSGYSSEAMQQLARVAETALTPAERIMLLSDTWASVRVGREPIGDYLALAEGLHTDNNRPVAQQLLDQLNNIGQDLVNDSDREAYRMWVRRLLAADFKEVGFAAKPGESDDQKALRGSVIVTLGKTAQDPEVMRECQRLAEQYMENPTSIDHELAFAVFRVAAINGDAAFYDQIMSKIKDTKSPEEYYLYLRTLADFRDPKLLQRTLEFGISSGVRSQDAIQVISDVLDNPAGKKVAWDFIRTRWAEVEKSGGPFASAEIVNTAGSFCESGDSEQVKNFFAAHPVSAAERTLKQSLERINYCLDLKAQQSGQLASWLGEHGAGTTGK